MKTKKKKGFTLTELIVVIVIIGVLAAVMIPTLTGYITKAQNSKDETLVASLNRSYENTKIMDDIEIYTAYDVQAFLKEVDMENIEVSNKSNLILFDTIEDKFVLVKENERNDAFYKEDNAGNLVLNNSGEFVINPSEYYKINHSFYEDTNAPAVVNLEYSKLSHEHTCKGTHRAFIVSTNGPEEAVAVATFMKINGSMETNTLNGNKYLKNEMIEIFTKSYSDSNFKEKLLNALSKTLFIDNVNGTNIYFYVDTNNNYKITNLPSSSAENQPALTRPTILPDVKEVDLSVISGLSQCTTIVPGTVESVKTESMGTTNDVSGNVKVLDDPSRAQDLDEALLMPLAKEILSTITEKIYTEAQLNEILKCYDSDNLINQLKEQLNLEDDSDIIKQLKSKLKGLTKTITIMGSFTISSPGTETETKIVTIPKDVYLYIPYNNEDIDIASYIEYKNNINDTSKVKEMKLPSSVNKDGTSNKFSKVNKKNGEEDRTNLKKELVIEKNVTLNIDGTVIVSGVTGVEFQQGLAGHTSGDYAQIKLESETSVISLGKTGVLDVYGYVIGKGKINTVEGSTINEPFVIGDFDGGSTSALLAATIDFGFLGEIVFNDNGTTAPFSQYGLVNIQTDINIVYGATLGGFVKLHFNETMNKNGNIPLSFISSKDGSFIIMESGSSINLSYSNNNISEESNLFSNAGKTTIKINGSIKTGKIDVTLDVFGYTATLSSNDFLLPIPFAFDIIFESGSSNIANDLALFLGCNMVVEKDAILTIEKDASLYVFDKFIVNNNSQSTSFSGTTHKYLNSNPANFIVNGSLIVEGTFGGIIQTEKRGAIVKTNSNAILDGSEEARFGSGTQSLSIGDILSVSTSQTSTMNNYSLIAYIATSNGLVELQKNKTYTSTYSSSEASLCKCNKEDTIKCWIAGEKSGSTKVVWAKKESSINRDGLTFYGDWTTTFTVKFNGYDSLTETKELNSQITKPTVSVSYDEENYYLDGEWYKDSALTQKWDFNNDRVTSDTTLYIGLRKYFDVIFYGRDETEYTKYKAKINEKISGPVYTKSSSEVTLSFTNGVTKTISSDNYYLDDFVGEWYTSNEINSEKLYDFDVGVTSDLKLYVGVKKYCTVTFYYKNNSTSYSQYGQKIIVVEGNTLLSSQIPSDPSGNKYFAYTYDFDYWKIDNKKIDLTTYSFSDDTKIYAEYTW